MWTPKGAALIREQRLFEARRLLEEIRYLKYKFGQIGPKIKALLNLHEYSHTRQFQDRKCKYDNKRIFKFKSKSEKTFFQYPTSGR